MSKIITEEEFLKQLSVKLSTPLDDIKLEFEAVVNEVRADEKFIGKTEEIIRMVARNKFHSRKFKEAASNAIPWEGSILGIADLIDTVALQKRVTDAAFKADPMKTMKGWVYNAKLVLSDEKGRPLYPKTEGNIKFKRAGMPLPEHSWLRTICGYARPINPKTKEVGAPGPFKMSINGSSAIDVSQIPMNTPVKFKGINKSSEDDRKLGEYKINHSTFTKFEKSDIKDFPPIEEVLKSVTQHYALLGELEEVHTRTEKDFGRWVITEGSVSNINLEPNAKTGNLFMILSDESLMFAGDGDKTGVMCWIPTDRGITIDFGVESRVFVVGRTSRGKAKDPTTGDLLDTPGDVMLNVYGLYAPEMFKVKVDIKPLTASSLSTEDKSGDEEWS